MPVCPGCERRVSYEQLPVHERYCGGIHNSGNDGSNSARDIENQLIALEERLTEEIHEHDEEIKSRLRDLERGKLRAGPE